MTFSRQEVGASSVGQLDGQPAWQPTLQALGSLFVAPAAAALVGGACLFGGADGALAAELTADQELVAQAWQKTDRNFVDRTFAGQDWFSVRQKMVKQKYASQPRQQPHLPG